MPVPPAPLSAGYRNLVERDAVDVIELEGQIAALLVSWREVDHYYVDNFAVDPAFQGAGLGAALLRYMPNKWR